MLDGFTVRDQASNTTFGAGISIGPGRTGVKIINNIVTNNATGLDLASFNASNPTIVQYNLFKENNRPGAHTGRAIYSNGGVSGENLTGAIIDSNAFFKNIGSDSGLPIQPAIGFEAANPGKQSNLRVTNNVFDANGKSILAMNIVGLLIEGNVVGYNRDTTSGALRFEGGAQQVTIRNNLLYASEARAIRIDNKFSSANNSGFVINNNNIFGNGQGSGASRSGLYVNSNQYSGGLDARNNWWGSSSGPSGDGPGTGDAVYANGNSVNFSAWTSTNIGNFQRPYTGAPQEISSTIEAEEFDQGGQGIAYSDTTSANEGDRLRPYLGVDIQATTDTGGGFNVYSVKGGEYIEYTVRVPATGTYNFLSRVASSSTAGSYHLEINGVNISGSIAVPNTGGSQTWQTTTKTGISLTAGTHVLRVAFDASGGNFNWFRFTPTSVQQPPAAPSSLAATAVSASKVTLTWQDNANNENGYAIERKTGAGGTWSQIGTTGTNATTYDDLTVAAGTAYVYRVRATSTSAGSSAYSNEASATVPVSGVTYLSDLQWVGTPTNGWGPVEKDMSVGGSGAGDGQTLTLNGVTYAKGLGAHANSEILYNLNGQYQTFISDVGIDDRQTTNGSVVFQVFADNVKIYESPIMRATTATQTINVSVAGVQQLKLVVTDAGDGNSFDHADWAGARLLAASSTGTAAPTTLTASANSTSQINLSWSDNSSDEEGFRIERSLNGSSGWTEIATTAANTATYNDSGLSAGTQYYYRVRAYKGSTNTAYTNVANATTQTVATAPAAPSGLTATAASSSQINLGWTDNASNETGFIVERSLDGTSGWTQVGTPAANATTFSNTGLSTGTQYFYRVRAVNGVGTSADSNVANATTQTSSAATFIPLGATWKYLDNGSDQGTAWRSTSFSDSAWKSGAAELGYGDGDEATVVSFGSSSSTKFITTYFRRTFSVADASAVSALSLRLLRDDGAVVYLNGTEVFRSNMPTGTISYTTRASSAVESNALLSAVLNPALLVNGNNVIAVEIHQDSPSSSDISFNLELTGTLSQPTAPPAAPTALGATAASSSQINLGWTDNANNETGFIVERSLNGTSGWTQVGTPAANATTFNNTGLSAGTQYFYRVRAVNGVGASADSNVASATTSTSSAVTFISLGSTWKYLDNGSNQGTAWRSTSFNDSAWKSGAAELGYGDGDEATVVSFGSSASAKFITTYFRRTFSVADASAVSALSLRLLRDDGAVVYLNGTEVFRSNMPTGTITSTTRASSAVESNALLSAVLNPALLVNGNNVIAVEIHQDSPSSSDISFNLELTGTASQPAAKSSVQPSNSTFSSTAIGGSLFGDAEQDEEQLLDLLA